MDLKIPANYDGTYTVEDYYKTPDGVHMELINGVIFNMAPPNRAHQKISGEIFGIIHDYIKSKGGSCEIYAAPFGVQLFPDDDTTIVEPDISVICDKNKLTDRGCTGAPDWIIEIISPTTTSRDYIKKRTLYKKAGVRYYWIVDYSSDAVTVLDYSKDSSDSYSFEDTVPSGLYEDLEIDFKKIKETLT